MTSPLPDGCAETPTVAVKEILLRKSWRGQGIALLIHDELLRDRPEAQVSLLVNALNGVCGLMSRFSVPLRRSFATFLVAAPHPCAHAARRRAGSMAIGQDADPARS